MKTEMQSHPHLKSCVEFIIFLESNIPQEIMIDGLNNIKGNCKFKVGSIIFLSSGISDDFCSKIKDLGVDEVVLNPILNRFQEVLWKIAESKTQ